MVNFTGRFPWSNSHELNLDWIIKEIKRLSKEIEELKKLH